MTQLSPSSAAPSPNAAGSTAEVRGTAFLGILKHLRDTGQTTSTIASRAPAITQDVMAERIRVLAWYPYDAFSGLLRTLDQHLGVGDLTYCRRLGEEASRRDLGTVFSFLAKLCSPERLIRSCGRVWGQYYRGAGEMEAISWDPNDTVLRIRGFDRMDPAHCQLMAGWMIQSMRTIGATVHDARETQCTSRGAPYHEFACRWSL